MSNIINKYQVKPILIRFVSGNVPCFSIKQLKDNISVTSILDNYNQFIKWLVQNNYNDIKEDFNSIDKSKNDASTFFYIYKVIAPEYVDNIDGLEDLFVKLLNDDSKSRNRENLFNDIICQTWGNQFFLQLYENNHKKVSTNQWLHIFLRLLEKTPEHPVLLFEVAKIYFENNKTAEAYEYLIKAVKLRNPYANEYYKKCLIHFYLTCEDKEKYYNDLKSLIKNDGEALLDFGSYLIDNNLEDKGYQLLLEAYKLDNIRAKECLKSFSVNYFSTTDIDSVNFKYLETILDNNANETLEFASAFIDNKKFDLGFQLLSKTYMENCNDKTELHSNLNLLKKQYWTISRCFKNQYKSFHLEFKGNMFKTNYDIYVSLKEKCSSYREREILLASYLLNSIISEDSLEFLINTKSCIYKILKKMNSVKTTEKDYYVGPERSVIDVFDKPDESDGFLSNRFEILENIAELKIAASFIEVRFLLAILCIYMDNLQKKAEQYHSVGQKLLESIIFYYPAKYLLDTTICEKSLDFIDFRSILRTTTSQDKFKKILDFYCENIVKFVNY